MKAVYNLFIQFTIRLGHLLSLIFFVLLLHSCKQNKKEEISIHWKNDQAAGIAIPKSFLKGIDSIPQLLQIRLENKEAAILGNYKIIDEDILFTPLIPFSPGLHYEVFFRNDLIGKINIPLADNSQAPVVVAVYPTADTLPENLLKFYFHFSAPMREGEALQHIFLLDSRSDTIRDVFLDLQPELWNKERTVLTLWLDPGRIKRDLIPNKKMGKPLQKGQQYSVVVSNEWKNVRGLLLQKQFTNKFWVGSRDSLSPQPQSWKIYLPKAKTTEPLGIDLTEPLDYFLLQETIRIVDKKGSIIKGSIEINNVERNLEFTPAQPWQEGSYRLQVISYLEDLAGNNLQRLFDRDIRMASTKKEEAFIEKEFVITEEK